MSNDELTGLAAAGSSETNADHEPSPETQDEPAAGAPEAEVGNGTAGSHVATTPLEGQLDELYRAPIASVADRTPNTSELRDAFYVVSIPKLLVLYIGTLGLYEVYWLYRHWQQHERYKGEYLRPFWRMVFSIFTTYGLFRRFDQEARDVGIQPAWSPNGALAALPHQLPAQLRCVLGA